MSNSGEVNPHYLGHVVEVSDTHDVMVSEDIVTGNGVKLLAKGAKISAEVKDRLLQHKLRKPLEDCVRVAGGVTSVRMEESARILIERHPLLRELTGGDDRTITAICKLRLTPALQSLLTVYSEHRPDKLMHAVCAGMLAHALARRLIPASPVDQERMLLAGLLHDVGELYIDPALLEKGKRLEPSQWKHIVTHPIVAHRLLKDMEGAGPVVADAVLQHHERLDGFGYPNGSRGPRVGVGGQILSVSELLVGLLESASQPLLLAVVAMKLIPGEFSRGTLDAVVTASQAATMMEMQLPSGSDASEQLVGRVDRMGATLRRFQSSRHLVDQEIARAAPLLKSLLDHAVERMHRLHIAFSSTGLDIGEPQVVVERLAGAGHGIQGEASLVLRELEWRLKELERETLMRAESLATHETPVVRRVIELMKSS